MVRYGVLQCVSAMLRHGMVRADLLGYVHATAHGASYDVGDLRCALLGYAGFCSMPAMLACEPGGAQSRRNPRRQRCAISHRRGAVRRGTIIAQSWRYSGAIVAPPR